MSADNITELVERAARGSCAAFTRLIESRIVPLSLFLRKRAREVLRGDCASEDLLQSVLLKAWESLPAFQYRGEGSFYGWLVQLARSTISARIKYLNAKGRDRAETLDRETPSGRFVPPELEETMTSMTSRVSRREQVANLERALETFPTQKRRIVELSFLEGLPLRDVARELGMARSTTWEQLRDAMSSLRQALETPVDP